MTATRPTIQDEFALANRLINGVIDRASGRAATECLLNVPRDVYFVGNLRSRLDVRGRTPLPGELLNKLAPFALGAEILVVPSATLANIEVTIRWCYYYRAF